MSYKIKSAIFRRFTLVSQLKVPYRYFEGSDSMHFFRTEKQIEKNIIPWEFISTNKVIRMFAYKFTDSIRANISAKSKK